MNPPPNGVITPIASRRRVAASVYGATSPHGTTTPRGPADGRPSDRIARRRALTHDGEQGFTLVELLVVVLMLVALVGIAVPTFVGQQDRAARAAVQSELRTAAIALESYRARNGTYASAALADPQHGFVRSLDVATFFDPDDFTVNAFCVRAWYDPLEPGEGRSTDADGNDLLDPPPADADTKTEWAITERGMVYLGDVTGDRSCP